MAIFIPALAIGIGTVNLVIYLCSFFPGFYPLRSSGPGNVTLSALFLLTLGQTFYTWFHCLRHHGKTRWQWAEILDYIPEQARLPYALMFGGVIIILIACTLISVFSGGSLAIMNGRYCIVDHDRYVRSLTYPQYQFQMENNDRVFIGGEWIFGLVAIVYWLYIVPAETERIR